MENQDQISNTAVYLKNYPNVKAFLAGSFSGMISAISLQPFEVIKTRLQNPLYKHKSKHSHSGPENIRHILSNILREGHIRELWIGTWPSLLRTVPGVGIYFCSLNFMKSHFFIDKLPNPLENIAMGVIARCTGDSILMPLTVVKTRVESGMYSYRSVFYAIKEIHHTEGVRGLTRGIVPMLMRDMPYSGLYYMFYSQSKQLVPKDFLNSSYSSLIHGACAASSSILSSIITHPPDVLKTRMQLYPYEFKGLWSAIVHIKAHDGFFGYFKGFLPRMMRRSFVSVISWTVYERIS
ncbi:unnamed protein product [Phaedon cochleariae]|uniref:Mitochondrial glycine transporter n=1 Tax=Phaedon cochleariae TaxID=80249 RepID=A0A9N9SMH9_PHACE|nr:unnamed protein product [Phaedon cochleariae]